jgi:hypothetical protein
MELNLSTTQRGKPVLLHEGHQYLVHKVKDNETVWRCREYQKKRCKSYMKTSRTAVLDEAGPHSHDGNPVENLVQAAMENLKTVLIDRLN